MGRDHSFITGFATGVFACLLILIAQKQFGLSTPPVTKEIAAARVPAIQSTTTAAAPAPVHTVPPPSTQLPEAARGPAGSAVTLIEYADFNCAHCRDVTKTINELKNEFPQIRHVFRHFPLSNTPGKGSFAVHQAAACAQEQGMFWNFYDAVMQPGPPPGPEELQLLIESIPLNRDRMQECVNSGQYDSFLREQRQNAQSAGVRSTPTFFLNGKMIRGAKSLENFREDVKNALNPGSPIARPGTTGEVREEPVVFKDLEGRPYLGKPDARVTIVEFSDFHCPYCKAVQPTLARLAENYPQDLRIVWRHYPLGGHRGADLTHKASECAHRQNRFWDFHREIFAGSPRTKEALTEIAASLGLKEPDFTECLEAAEAEEAVQNDLTVVRELKIRGTPTFFVNGKRTRGNLPYEAFDNLIRKELEAAKS